MAALVTLAVAATHIKADWTVAASPADARDAELQIKVDAASDIILSYLKVPVTSPPLYDETTVPARVQAAILLMVAHLWEHRGDDVETMDDLVWDAVARLLVRDRDPALA